MTALFGWVGRNVAYKDLSLLKLGCVFGLKLTEGRKSVYTRTEIPKSHR